MVCSTSCNEEIQTKHMNQKKIMWVDQKFNVQIKITAAKRGKSILQMTQELADKLERGELLR
jgi:hypothetical protein